MTIIHRESWIEPNTDPPKTVEMIVRHDADGVHIEIHTTVNIEHPMSWVNKSIVTLGGYSMERVCARWREGTK